MKLCVLYTLIWRSPNKSEKSGQETSYENPLQFNVQLKPCTQNYAFCDETIISKKKICKVMQVRPIESKYKPNRSPRTKNVLQ